MQYKYLSLSLSFSLSNAQSHPVKTTPDRLGTKGNIPRNIWPFGRDQRQKTVVFLIKQEDFFLIGHSTTK